MSIAAAILHVGVKILALFLVAYGVTDYTGSMALGVAVTAFAWLVMPEPS